MSQEPLLAKLIANFVKSLKAAQLINEVYCYHCPTKEAEKNQVTKRRSTLFHAFICFFDEIVDTLKYEILLIVGVLMLLLRYEKF